MADTPKSDTNLASPVGLRPAAYLGAALVLGMTAVIALLAGDRSHRGELESASENTAVGDEAHLAHRTRGPAPDVTLQGRRLVPPSPRHVEVRDTRMQRAGEVDGGALRLYTTSEQVPWEKGEVQDESRPVYYLKVGTHEYLRVQ